MKLVNRWLVSWVPPMTTRELEFRYSMSVRARKVVNRLVNGGAYGGADCPSEAAKPIIANMTKDDILMAKNCGLVTLLEIQAWLKASGMSLKDARNP